MMASLFAIVVHGLILAARSDATPFHDYRSPALSGVLTTLLIPQIRTREFYPLNRPFWSLLFELPVNVVCGDILGISPGRRTADLVATLFCPLLAVKVEPVAIPSRFLPVETAPAITPRVDR
jgi:hypothetical protein